MFMRTLKDFKLKCIEVWEAWIEANIFKWRIWDAIAYTLLYVIVPIILSYVSLIPKQHTTIAYGYLTILISAIGIIYDATGRVSKLKMNKIKISSIIILNLIITVYCFFEIVMILAIDNLEYRLDKVFFIFIIFSAIILSDVLNCLLDWILH